VRGGLFTFSTFITYYATKEVTHVDNPRQDMPIGVSLLSADMQAALHALNDPTDDVLDWEQAKKELDAA
jgi:hypothetical protein